MRNLLGGLIGAILGSISLVVVLQLEPATYPDPYNSLAIILTGCVSLSESLLDFLNANTFLLHFAVWLFIGLITGIFSDSNWNSVRTAVWVGVIVCLLSIASILLLDPAFWPSSDRNLRLVLLFSGSIISALLTLPSCLVVIAVKKKIMEETEPSAPEKIETICECGAVFKSIPQLCSECGATLSDDESVT